MEVKILNFSGQIITNTFRAICVWDFNDFSDECFGAMPEGWYKSQYPFIDYAILMTFTGGKGYNEWCSLENGRLITDFKKPVRILKNVIRQGIKPIIVIGNVPSALSDGRDTENDSYGWGNRCPPKDYSLYYDYIKAFAGAVKLAFPYEIYKDFIFRVGTENDNFHWFLGTEEEYLKLYDYTVAALTEVLGEEIKIGPANLESADGYPGLLKHCAEGINFFTGKTGTKCDFFSISHYEMGNPPVSYEAYAPKARMARRRAEAYPKLNITDINIGEGEFLSDGMSPSHRLLMAQDCSEYGASWHVQNFAASLENGISYFANWAYCCDYRETSEPLIKTPAYFAALLCGRLCGLYSLKCSYSAPKGSAAGCIAAYDKTKSVLYALCWNHRFEREAGEPLNIKLCVDGFIPENPCTVYRIDKTHNNFSAEWLEISKNLPRLETAADFDILGSVLETEISKTLNEDGLKIWKNFKYNYSRNELISEKEIFTDSIEFTIPCHGVILLEIPVKGGSHA